MKFKALIVSSLLLPIVTVAALVLNQQFGTLSGQGHARTHNFPVIAQTFDITISDPDVNGLRTLKVVVPIKDITTNIGLRNTHMRTSMFNLKQYPNIVYTASSDKAIEAGHYILDGMLSINGVTKPHRLEVTLEEMDGKLMATGSTVVTPTDFDLPLPGMGPMKVLDHVEMAYNVEVPQE